MRTFVNLERIIWRTSKAFVYGNPDNLVLAFKPVVVSSVSLPALDLLSVGGAIEFSHARGVDLAHRLKGEQRNRPGASSSGRDSGQGKGRPRPACRGNSAGSKSPAGAACSRTISSTTGVVPTSLSPPSPALRAAASARPSHHMSKTKMIADAMMLSPGAAKVVVPKSGIGTALLTVGVPGILAGLR
jgi:hypothetical protein